MPNRILKNSICDSENISQLTPEQEVFFYRLIVNCDDFGRMDARATVLIARCYPLRIDTIKQEAIQSWIKGLTDADLINLYTVNNQPYIQIKKWNSHQNIRAKKSRYPDPNGHSDIQLQASEIICKQENTITSKCPRNPIQSINTIQSNQPVAGNDKLTKITELYTSSICTDIPPLLMKELEKLADKYEYSWFEYAIGESVKNNARNFKYVQAILENCSIKGFIPSSQVKEQPRKVIYKELK
jgi:DNA replication protein DnaD